MLAVKPDPTEIALKTVVNARKLLRVGVLLAVGLLLSACQQKAKVGNVEGPTGVYTLVTVK